MTIRSTFSVALTLSAVLLVGCGGDDDGHGDESTESAEFALTPVKIPELTEGSYHCLDGECTGEECAQDCADFCGVPAGEFGVDCEWSQGYREEDQCTVACWTSSKFQ